VIANDAKRAVNYNGSCVPLSKYRFVLYRVSNAFQLGRLKIQDVKMTDHRNRNGVKMQDMTLLCDFAIVDLAVFYFGHYK